MPRLADRLDDAINPLMVKEAQQSLRSRALFACGAIALFIPLFLFQGPGSLLITSMSHQRDGRNYYMVVVGVVGLVMSIILPIKAAQELSGEIKSRTIDLLLLTNLSPWELAVGRFQAAALQLVLLLSFTLPFAVAALGLGGIGAGAILGNLLFVSLLGCVECTAALLATTTLLHSRAFGALALLGFSGQLLFVGFGSLGLSLAATDAVEPLLFAWMCLLMMGVVVLFLRLTADLLTRGRTSTSAYSKLALAGLLGLYVLPRLAAGRDFASLVDSSSDRRVMMAFGLCWLYFFVLLWSGTAVRNASPKLSRFWLLADGYVSTLAYAAVLSAALSLLGHAEERVLAAVFFAYFVLFSGLAALAHAHLPRALRTSETYFVAVLLWAMFDLVAALPFLEEHSMTPRPPTPWHALIPLSMRYRQLESDPHWLLLPLALGVCALLWARARNARLARG